MQNVNIVTLLGRMGADAELKTTNGGRLLASLRIATTNSYKGKDGVTKESTDWHSVTVWGPPAQACERLKKGDPVFVQGRLQTRSYEKDGQKRYITEVNADKVVIFDGVPDAPSAPAPRQQSLANDDDVPF